MVSNGNLMILFSNIIFSVHIISFLAQECMQAGESAHSNNFGVAIDPVKLSKNIHP